MFGEIEAARIFIREGRLPLNDGHLMDLLGLFGAGHFGSPNSRERMACLSQLVKWGNIAQKFSSK
jgi:hypothetical protein